MRKNKYLAKLLQEKGLDNEETWRTIMLNHGSVQHLNELTEEEKAVFKTFREISPMEIISQAAQRQQYIDQAQSLNLQIPSTMPVKDVNYLYIEAVKTLYYQRSSSVSKEMMVNFVTCSSCEA
jgi:ribonucleoside-diphosphate reductase alpha chain